MKASITRSCAAITVAGAMLFAGNVSMADTVMDRDNNAANFISGVWGFSTAKILYYGDNYRFAWGGPLRYMDFRSPTTIDSTGTWCLYARWTTDPNRHTAVNYQFWDGGTLRNTYTANQQINGGAWIRLGCDTLTRGNYSYVRLTNVGAPTNRVVIADGVRWVKENFDKFEINDEAGLEFGEEGSFNVASLAVCSSGWTLLRGMTLSPPRSPSTGYAVLRASGQVYLGVNDQSVAVGIDDSSSTTTVDQSMRLEAFTPEAGSAWEGYKAYSLQEVYSVSGSSTDSFPANRVFYLKACRESTSATGTVYWDDVTATYYPTRY